MAHEYTISTTRIEMFSDAVIAIIVTPLVLDLKVPELARAATNQDTVRALLALAPSFVSFVLSFFIVCIFWVNHHQFFHVLKKADRRLLWFNNILLFWLCFIPFPTAFLGRYPTNQIAVMLFGGVLCCAAISFSIMSYHAMFVGNLLEEHISQKEKRKAQQRSYWGIFLYGLSILASFVSVYISLAIFLIVPLIYFVPRRLVYSLDTSFKE